MSPTRWIVVIAAVVATVQAAPRELNSDELITEPRPGEEYVHIQTGPPASQDKLDLQEKSFTTSHRIPQYSKKPKSEPFQTSHKIPTYSVKSSKSLKSKSKAEESSYHEDNFQGAESDPQPVFEQANATEVPVQVVTRTSVKMSKSKKVQKSVLKAAHDDKVDIKSDEGVIDETKNADAEEVAVMAKKLAANENGAKTEDILKVPFEPEPVTDQTTNSPDNPEPTTTAWTVTTTEEPPVTTFNYKNTYDKPKKSKEAIEALPESKEKLVQEKYRYDTIPSESLRTAETRNTKKDTKQDKKDNPKRIDETDRSDELGFEIVPLGKARKLNEENFDFVDADEKILVPAASSPSQSSRINIKKGPNGQDYEYEYVYYYYDEEDDGGNGTANLKEGKVVASTTEQVYNGHDGPSVEHRDHDVPSSTSGNKYLPTETPRISQNVRNKPQDVSIEEEEEEEVVPTHSRDNNNRYSSISRPVEPVNNEILPATSRPSSRPRGRITNTPGVQPVPADDIPTITDDRLPANTRFPPRSRSNNVATSPQPQETTSRTRSRENNSQSRVRLPNLGLLDSSSFRTHASDASIDEDPIHETELQRRPSPRPQTTEATEVTHARRGSRPTTTSTTTTTTRRTVDSAEEDTFHRRPAIRRPTEDKRHKVEVDSEEQEQIRGNGRRPETTRESDSEEGDFDVTKVSVTTARKPITTSRVVETTTEDLSSIGLTSAMMEKVALDLYAILQQAHNENIRSNFIDGNGTDPTVDGDEYVTDVTTTSSTTTEPTTTTTTTTTPAPVTERGRYRSRGGISGSKTRSRTSVSSSTTEHSPEGTTAKTRGRIHPSYSSRGSSATSLRRGARPKEEKTQEDPAVQEEVTKQTAEKSFGERPSRTRYRSGTKTTSTTTTSAPQISGAAAVLGGRSSLDRYSNRRRAGSRVTISTTHQPDAEEASEEVREEVQEVSRSTEEVHSTSSTLKPSRGRVTIGGARPLRPGPRVPLTLTQKGRATTSTTQVPTEPEEIEKEIASAEEHAPQVVEEAQETPTTPVTDALTRLKNRPRLRIGANSAQHRPQTTAAPTANRKKLVSSLLPKRKPQAEEKALEKVDDIEKEKIQEEAEPEEELVASSIEPSSTTAEPETKGLSGLLAGRRRNLNRRPGTIYSRNQAEA